jgi:dienelactone hydrolase
MQPQHKKPMDPNFKVIAILGACFGGAIALSGSLMLGVLTAIAAFVAGLLATQPRAPKKTIESDGRLIRCPGAGCHLWIEPTRRRCATCEREGR